MNVRNWLFARARAQLTDVLKGATEGDLQVISHRDLGEYVIIPREAFDDATHTIGQYLFGGPLDTREIEEVRRFLTGADRIAKRRIAA